MDTTQPVQSESITCSMCGHRFDPATNGACGSCPLAPGCQVVCCPVCRFETVDPRRSVLVRSTRRISDTLQGWLSRRQ